MADRVEPERTPTLGDHLSRFTYAQAAPWLGVSTNTLRGYVADGTLPRRFVSRLGAKVWMSGDQLARAIQYAVQTDTLAPRRAVRRPRRRAA